MANIITEPRQQRSIDKKNRIIEAGYKLFSEKGYYHTNTAEIAKEAGVSTGIVYRYFSDKKAIFFESMNRAFQVFDGQFFNTLNKLTTFNELRDFLDEYIEFVIQSHLMSKSTHEEITAMAHYDEDVAEFFHEIEERSTDKIVSILPNIGITTSHPHEKIHIIINMLENYCHEVVYNKRSCKDYTYMKKILIDMSLKLLECP